MANNSKRQELKDLECLIRETDEKLRETDEKLTQSIQEVKDQNARALEEFMDQNKKAMDEIRLLISGIAQQTTEVASQSHSQFANRNDGILGPGGSSLNASHYAKLEFPRFDGFGIHEWLYKVEQFFEIDHTLESNKVKMASIHLDGKALNWFKVFLNTKERGRLIPWYEFVKGITARFGEQMFLDPISELKKLKQLGSVQQYLEEFDMLLSKAELNETQALSHFLGGLKEEIEMSVRLFNPTNLQSAYALAKVQELLWLKKGKVESGINHRSDNNSAQNTRAVTRTFVNAHSSVDTNKSARFPAPKPGISNTHQTKKLSSKELDERRRQGLCFWCDDKFVPGHVCKKKQFYMLTVEDDDQDSQEVTDNIPEMNDEIENESPQLSFHALTGAYSFQTMRVKGSVGTKTIFLLIDSGSTHNFLSSKFAKQIGCPLESISELKVTAANGNVLSCKEKCQKFSWNMQGYKFKADFLILPLDNYDMILGIQWLSELGDITWNFKNLQMKFQYGDQSYSLKGEIDTQLQWTSGDKMKKLMSKESQLSLNQCCTITIQELQHSKAPKQEELFEQLHSLPTIIAEVLRKNAVVFQEPKGLPPQRLHDHRIRMKEGSQPVCIRPYRYGVLQKNIIEKLTQELQESGVIQDSNSPYSSPVVLVKKKDNSWRLCIDYRSLNNLTIKDKFPIPIIEELLDELHGATIFSKLDLRAGYHQIRMHPDDIHKTAFRTHVGHYEFKVMPFGLTNAPSTFQSLMNEVFKTVLRKFVLVFFDDILIYSTDLNQHAQHLDVVMKLLLKNTLFAKMSKCSFAVESVEYLGHIITGKGVSTDFSKIQAVQNWPLPKKVKQLRGFLGLAGYYRRFIKDYAALTDPLYKLLKKPENLQWCEAAQMAFERVKQALTSAPVLALPNFEQPFIIETDASKTGIGAVLLQQGHPIAYISKTLSSKHQTLPIYEKEMFAILFAVKKWEQYLMGRHFIIKTDHQPLKYLLEQKVTTPSQYTWLSKLMSLDYEIQYKSGKSNTAADALSRVNSPEIALQAISTISTELLTQIKESWQGDNKLQEIIHKLQQGETHSHYTWVQDQLLRKGRLVIGPNQNLKEQLLNHFHSSTIGGHSGVHATYQRLITLFYWKGMWKNVREFIRKCTICQCYKPENVASPGLIQPLPTPQSIFTDVTMDFIEGLPKSKGKDVILVVVDRLTKYAHFMALSHPYTAAIVAQTYVDNVYKLHGFPASIISDRDPIFLSNFWKEFFRIQGVQLKHSSAYHPQTDGQSEVVNRCLECYLRCMTGNLPKSWSNWLSLAEFWYNTCHHSSIKMSPFQALYGVPPPLHLPYFPRDSPLASVDSILRDREAVIQLLKQQLSKAKQRMEMQANKHRTDRTFEIGDMVYLKLQPHLQNSVVAREVPKFAAKYYGPYKIVDKIGKVAYKLDLPATSEIHPVFHVSLLKKANVEAPLEAALPPSALPTSALKPLAILDRRITKRGNTASTQWLVHWENHPPSEATWEFAKDLRIRFPDFP